MARDAKGIDFYLQMKGSPLAGLGAEFVKAGRRHGVDPKLMVAISGAESAFGKHLNGSFNPFGWGPGIDFGSFPEAIDAIARGLRKGYLNEGRKSISAIGAKWAPVGASNDPTNLNSNWAGNVGRFYRELGGKRAAATPRGSQAAPAASGVKTAPPPRGQGSGLLPNLLAQAFQSNNELLGLDTPDSVLSMLAAPPAVAPALPPSSGRAPLVPQGSPASGVASAAPSGGLNELFFDPRGAYDEGSFIPAIGGHDKHLHASITNPQQMIWLINEATKRGLSVRENPYVDKVDPVHTSGSFHDRNFKGKFNGRTLGQGVDISGGDLGKLFDDILARFGVKR